MKKNKATLLTMMASRTQPHPLERQPLERAPRQRRVGYRVLDVGVAQVLLHRPNVRAAVDQVYPAGVA